MKKLLCNVVITYIYIYICILILLFTAMSNKYKLCLQDKEV